MASFTTTNHMLNGLVSDIRGTRPGPNSYRRYASGILTTSTVHGAIDTRAGSIVFEVGSAVADAEAALDGPVENAPRGTETGYPTSFVLAEDFLGFAKKHSNFSASFEFTSLAGVAERLARSLATWTLFEEISSDDIAGGLAVNVSVLNSHAAPVNSLTSSVFIPRLVSTTISPDTFGVLVAAIAGEGASIVTDVLILDEDGSPQIPTCRSDGLPLAIVESLRVIGSNMVASDQGPLFALAVTRGIHRVLSVVGHTDEGGVMRDVLRAGSFATPFGGVHYGLSDYAGLPALSSCSVAGVSAYVDTIAITTAAAVAHADPGCVQNGVWYPTVIDCVGEENPVAPAGTVTAGTAAMAANGRSLLLSSLPAFAHTYVSALGTIFGASGDTGLAVKLMVANAGYLNDNNRHLRHATVAPFFWIEPTGVLSPNAFGTVAESEGAGSLCGRNSTTTNNAFTHIEKVSDCGLTQADYVVGFKGARFAPFLHHWHNNPRNGLGAVLVKQLDPESVVLPGPAAGHDLVRDRVMANLDLSQFLWRRGQSMFPAPAEFLVTSGAIGISIRHASFSDMGVPRLEHLPRQDEMLNCSVSITASRLRGLTNGASNWATADVRRARTVATRELNSTRLRSQFFGTVDTASMGTSCTAPSFTKKVVDDSRPVVAPTVNRLDGDAADSAPPTGGDEVSTEDVPVTTLVGTKVGPIPPRSSAGVAGTGGRAPALQQNARFASPPQADTLHTSSAVEPVPATQPTAAASRAVGA